MAQVELALGSARSLAELRLTSLPSWERADARAGARTVGNARGEQGEAHQDV